jgi:hypothetical protein
MGPTKQTGPQVFLLKVTSKMRNGDHDEGGIRLTGRPRAKMKEGRDERWGVPGTGGRRVWRQAN